MNLYKLMKMAVGHGLPRPVKLTGLAAMFRLRHRTAGVFLDPVMACNLRCRMCYFSDPKKRVQMKGIMSERQLDVCAKSIFPFALKLQIGCGAEPTLYPNLEQIIATGRKYGVPYISLTTNGPQSCYKEDFNPEQETYAAYHKRRHTVRLLLGAALRPASSGRGKNISKKLNYTIK